MERTEEKGYSSLVYAREAIPFSLHEERTDINNNQAARRERYTLLLPSLDARTHEMGRTAMVCGQAPNQLSPHP